MTERSRNEAIDYRRKAGDLIRMSQRQKTLEAKNHLLGLASVWLELADQADQAERLKQG